MDKITGRKELFDLMESVSGTGEMGVVINRMIDAMETRDLISYKPEGGDDDPTS